MKMPRFVLRHIILFRAIAIFVLPVLYHQSFATYAAARTAIFDYIETFYNRIRLHSSLAYLSPFNFESKLNQITHT
jgi:transposase InsO family protein